jgi:membrane protein
MRGALRRLSLFKFPEIANPLFTAVDRLGFPGARSFFPSRFLSFMFGLLKDTYREFNDDNCLQIAAALSYYTIFSLPPLLVIVISVAGMVVDPQDVQRRLDDEIGAVVGSAGIEQIDTMIEQAQLPGRGLWGTLLGVVMLLVGATGVMVQLQAALNQAWDVKPDPEQSGIWGFLFKRVLSLGMILAIAFLLLVSLVVTTMLTALAGYTEGLLPEGVGASFVKIGNLVVSLGVFTVLFAGMYKYLPDAEIAWKNVWTGAVLTGLLFMVAKWGLGEYLGRSDVGSTYGAAGALALLLIWIYYSAAIFLFGAEFTQVWARRAGEEIEPSAGAIRAGKDRGNSTS